MTGTNGMHDDEAVKRVESAWARRRDVATLTKDYSLFVLRTLILLNGGAIVAMLAFIGNIYGRKGEPPIKIADLAWPVMVFTVGLAATVAAGLAGYLNFALSQRRYGRPIFSSEELRPSSAMKIAAGIALVFAVVALGLFMLGVSNVVTALAR